MFYIPQWLVIFLPESQDQLQGVCQLSGATWAFAAVKSDGSVVTWGDERKGGNSSHVQDGYIFTVLFLGGGWVCVDCSWFLVDVQVLAEIDALQEQLVNVKKVCASSWSFAALRCDGHVPWCRLASCWGFLKAGWRLKRFLYSAWPHLGGYVGCRQERRRQQASVALVFYSWQTLGNPLYPWPLTWV